MMASFWTGKKVVVTGGAGFVGSHVVDNLLHKRGVRREDIVIPRSRDCNLQFLENAKRAVKGADIVLHLAASMGGLGYSSAYPAAQYYNNLLVDLQVVEAAHLEGVAKLVSVSSACAYPRDVPYPLVEESLWDGLPQETNRAYGLAKRMLAIQAEAYRKQYGMDIAVVVGANSYGPRDNFDLKSGHVIPALIRKCHEEKELVVWGDGSATRDFLYVEDFAKGVVLAAEKLNSSQPVNIGTGRETSIRELAELVVKLTGFQGKIVFDPSQPRGQPERVVSIERARRLLGFEPRFSLEAGLRRTIDWYRQTFMASLPGRT